MHVSAILKEKGDRMITIKPDLSVSDAAKVLAQERIGAVLVVSGDGELAGILSERDIVRGLSSVGVSLMGQKVEELMTKSVVTCSPSDDIDHLMRNMTSHRIRHLPVMDDGKLSGVISIGDVVKFRLDELESESSMLREYIEHG